MSATGERQAAAGTAYGKAILLGEHAVVHGHAALAGALALGAGGGALRCRARRAGVGDGGRGRLRVPAWGLDVDLGDAGHPVATAIGAALATIGAPALTLEVETALPAGAGLGSSAALAVAVVRAAAALHGGATDDAVADAADAAERCFHTNPSGVDVALATRGGIGVFRRGVGLTAIECPPLEVVIGLSGEPRTTAAMVQRVAAALAADPGVAARLAALGAAAARGAEALITGELAALGGLMNAAHHELAALGVSSPGLDRLVRLAGQAGALGAKLTGAGGGGAALALAPGRQSAVLEAWRDAGFSGFRCQLGARSAP